MKRKLARFGLVLLVLVVAAISFAWYTSPSRRINREAFERLHEGISKKEVEEILGPPGNHASARAFAIDPETGAIEQELKELILQMAQDPKSRETVIWASNSGAIFLRFENDVARRLAYIEVAVSARDRLKEWFRLSR